MNRETACFCYQLQQDSSQEYPTFGMLEGHLYTIDLPMLAKRLARTNRELPFLQAVLGAWEALERRRLLGSTLRSLAPYKKALQASLESVTTIPKGTETPKGVVTLFSDLEDSEKGLSRPHLNALYVLAGRVVRMFEKNPTLYPVLAEAIVEDCGGIATRNASKVCFDVPLLMNAIADIELVKFDAAVANAAIRPYQLTANDEALMTLSGERAGVYVVGSYYGFVISEVCDDVLEGCEASPLIKYELVARHLHGNVLAPEAAASIVKFSLKNLYPMPRGIRDTTEQQLKQELELKYPHLKGKDVYFLNRIHILEKLDQASSAPDRRGGVMLSGFSSSKRNKPKLRTVKTPLGVLLASHGGELYFDVDSLPMDQLLSEVKEGPDSRKFAKHVASFCHKSDKLTKLGHNLMKVSALGRKHPEITNEWFSAVYADITTLATKMASSGLSVKDCQEQQNALQRKSRSLKSRLLVKFSMEQDALIKKHWKPYLKEEARTAIHKMMPEHSWTRIVARAKLIRSLTNAGGYLEELDDDAKLASRVGRQVIIRYAKALGGSPRVVV